MSNKPPSYRFTLSLRTPPLPLPLKRVRPYSAQAPPAYTHKSSRTTAVIDSRVVFCYSHVLQFQKKTKENVEHTNNALTQQSRHGNLQVASLGKDPTLPFRSIFGRYFFCDSLFRRTVPSGWSGRREVLSGGCFPSSLLLGGAAWPSPSLGGVALPLAPFGPVFFLFWEPSPPKGGRRKAERPEGGGQAAPPARQRRESSTTEGRRDQLISTLL